MIVAGKFLVGVGTLPAVPKKITFMLIGFHFLFSNTAISLVKVL